MPSHNPLLLPFLPMNLWGRCRQSTPADTAENVSVGVSDGFSKTVCSAGYSIRFTATVYRKPENTRHVSTGEAGSEDELEQIMNTPGKGWL